MEGQIWRSQGASSLQHNALTRSGEEGSSIGIGGRGSVIRGMPVPRLWTLQLRARQITSARLCPSLTSAQGSVGNQLWSGSHGVARQLEGQ